MLIINAQPSHPSILYGGLCQRYNPSSHHHHYQSLNPLKPGGAVISGAVITNQSFLSVYISLRHVIIPLALHLCYIRQ